MAEMDVLGGVRDCAYTERRLEFYVQSEIHVPERCEYRACDGLVALYYLAFTTLSTIGGDALTKAGWNEYLVLAITMLLNFATEYLYQKRVVYKGKIDTAK